MSVQIRLATEQDSSQILEIYRPFIETTNVSFEYEVPSEIEFTKRIRNILQIYPWLVCEENKQIIGYAYASKHSARAAYQWSVDFSIYIKPTHHRKHIATALYTALVEILKIQGYYNAFACVTSPNVSSERFHESFGFIPIGVYHHVGYKLEKWHDVKWFEFLLSELPQNPATPKTINGIKDTLEFNKIIENTNMLFTE